jgi:hypothetical protein
VPSIPAPAVPSRSASPSRRRSPSSRAVGREPEEGSRDTRRGVGDTQISCARLVSTTCTPGATLAAWLRCAGRRRFPAAWIRARRPSDGLWAVQRCHSDGLAAGRQSDRICSFDTTRTCAPVRRDTCVAIDAENTFSIGGRGPLTLVCGRIRVGSQVISAGIRAPQIAV